MTRRLRRAGRVTVALPAARALLLFTPEGERAWVTGWSPRYVEDGADDTAPGTVFTTDVHGVATTWIVIDRDAGGYRYARVVPGHTAGTVTVRAATAGTSRTVVEVAYDLSALSADGARDLSALDGTFDELMATWAAALAAVEQRGRCDAAS